MNVIGNVNMKILQTFLAVAEYGSFRQAAEILHRSHSSISAQIKQLEDQLEVTLFDRTTRSVKLTEEGVFLRDSARKALYEVQLGIRRIRETRDFKRGQISLASSSNLAAFYLPPVLTAFVREFPEISLKVRELPSRDLFAAVKNKEVDFAVGPQIDDEEFDFDTIMVESLHALIPPGLTELKGNEITLEQVCQLPMLLSSPRTAMRKILDEAMEKNDLSVSAQYQFIQAETLIAMAEAGLGIAIQPSSRLSRVDTSKVRIVDLVDPVIERRMAVITHRNQYLSPAAERLSRKIIHDVRKATQFRTPQA
ncbi:LysR family transcriptional regulator [uncultured Cohaesibacter sp.]|uniref:LysR family transcriptional regulator n=1 Tax=uncultured Cohaesibacter sp. TaxID=1002546 RepID=UPI0029C756C5|nr:LysR family transcriptional regulator [uncultured Cohaesibacter sp.]